MIKIFYSESLRKVTIKWKVMKGSSGVPENFRRSKIFMFVFGHGQKIPVECNPSHNEIIAELPNNLPADVYSLRLVWFKDNITKRCMSEVKDAFIVTDYEDEATPVQGDTAILRINSSVATYGYDGLDAYELSVIYGKTMLTLEEWLNRLNGSGIDSGSVGSGAYIGQCECTNEQFAELTDTEITSGVVKAESGQFAATKSCVYMLIPSGKSITKFEYVSSGITSDVKGNNSWNVEHGNIEMEGVEYAVFGYRFFGVTESEPLVYKYEVN